MADTPSTRSPTSPAGQSTSQLLDELDALMQRMLTLPVQDESSGDGAESAKKKEAQPEPIVAAKTKAPRSVNLVPIAAPAVTVQAPAVANSPPVVIAGKIPAFWPASTDARKSAPRNEQANPSHAVPPPAAAPLLPILLQRPKVSTEKHVPLLPPAPCPTDTAPKGKVPDTNQPRPEAPSSPRPVWLQAPAVTAPPPPPVGVMRWLVTINAIFDGCTAILGGIGRWLRGEQGRALIGVSGLVMIVAAVIWALILFRG